jgi:hypothetical protein
MSIISRIPSPEIGNSPIDLSGNSPKLGPRKFHNGWTKEQEKLMAEWADMAKCYRWLHDRCEKQYFNKNLWITMPVIILSTITGTANFAIGSLVGNDPEGQKYAQATIGTLSILAGILTTIGNYLRYAQGSAEHRIAGIAWGKFQRQIAVELALHPNERIDCMDFLKICRAELDRLIEQSPPIPDLVIQAFNKEFIDVTDVKRPEICNRIEHTHVFDDAVSRMKMVTSEAAMVLMHKKRMLRQEVLPDLDKIIEKKVGESVKEKIEDLSGQIFHPITLPPSHATQSRVFDIDYRRFLKPVPISASTIPSQTTNREMPSILSSISPASTSNMEPLEQIQISIAPDEEEAERSDS